MSEGQAIEQEVIGLMQAIEQEVIAALIAKGYTKPQAEIIVNKLTGRPLNMKTVESIIMDWDGVTINRCGNRK